MTTSTSSRTTWLELPGLPDTPGLRARRFRDAGDFAAMASVTHQANLHDAIPWLPTEAQLKLEIEGEEGIDAQADITIVEIDGTVVAEAQVWRVIRAARPVFEIGGHVVPEVRGRGIERRALLAENVRRAVERAAADPVRLRAFADEHEAAHRALLARAGFSRSVTSSSWAAATSPRSRLSAAGWARGTSGDGRPTTRDHRRRDRGLPGPLGIRETATTCRRPSSGRARHRAVGRRLGWGRDRGRRPELDLDRGEQKGLASSAGGSSASASAARGGGGGLRVR